MYSKYKQIFKNCDQDYLDVTFLKPKDFGKKETVKKNDEKNEKKEKNEKNEKKEGVNTTVKKTDVKKNDNIKYNNIPLENDPSEEKKYLYNDTDIQDISSYRYDIYNPQRGNYIQQDIERNKNVNFTKYDPRKGNSISSKFNVSNTSNENLESYENTNSSSLSKPSEHKCGISKDGKSLCGNNKDLDPILEPLFNLREVCKQMILLEDHLFQPKRRCEDCIKKHSLATEGFLEEAITLDIKAEYHKLINDTIVPFKKIMKNVDNKMKDGKLDDETCVNAAQEIRLLRKELCLISYSAC
jgi:hypothetical protein